MDETDQGFLLKALESLHGAESECASGRYNNCASRCYYACFQAAVQALVWAGIRPRSSRGQWGHDFVQAEFAGQLIGRRKLYSAALRTTLSRTLLMRVVADYEDTPLSEREAARSLRWAKPFVAAIRSTAGEPR
jgi:uncharacterized protein (UPF0332 family)